MQAASWGAAEVQAVANMAVVAVVAKVEVTQGTPPTKRDHRLQADRRRQS